MRIMCWFPWKVWIFQLGFSIFNERMFFYDYYRGFGIICRPENGEDFDQGDVSDSQCVSFPLSQRENRISGVPAWISLLKFNIYANFKICT